MKEQYIAKYFEYRYYADFVLPIAIIGVLLLVWIVCRILYCCAKKYEKKYEVAIGKYDEELNQKNRSIAIGQGKTADMRGEE